MASMTKGEMAAIYLRPAFGNEDFSFEDAQEYLAVTDFGKFYKNSWNSMIKKNILIVNEDGSAHFPDEEDYDDEGPINSAWTNEHRKHFVCEEDESKSGFGDFFTKADLPAINEMYFDWKALGEKFQKFGFRRPTLPEAISEGLSGALFGWARTNNLPLVNIEGSADLVDIIKGSAIQVKGISVYGDGNGAPTSFGPKSKFDRLIVVHVRIDQDKAYFYEMNAKEYKDWKVNGQMSLREQQKEGKRPRLILLPIIKEQNLTPFLVYDFNSGTI